MIDTIYSDPNFLEHYGVKGMKWGVRKEEPINSGARRKGSSDKRLSNKTKKAIGIAVGTAALATIGVIGIKHINKANVELGMAQVDRMLQGNRDDILSGKLGVEGDQRALAFNWKYADEAEILAKDAPFKSKVKNTIVNRKNPALQDNYAELVDINRSIRRRDGAVDDIADFSPESFRTLNNRQYSKTAEDLRDLSWSEFKEKYGVTKAEYRR